MSFFDRKLLRHRRDRAAPDFARHAALFDESADQLIDRLQDIRRVFASILDLGAHDGRLAGRLAETYPEAFVLASDLSESMLRKASVSAVVADEELLPFGAKSFDLITSNLSLHWVEDLPGTLTQIRHALQPGGVFMAALLGGETLHELRACFLEAEMNIMGGASPRLSPILDLPTATALLQRAGFAVPVVDAEKITLTYGDAFALMQDLRGMGETNAHMHRLRKPSRRTLFFEAAKLYRDRFADAEAHIPATFEVIFLHGWKD